jgi:membrane-associated phospholipid phosphatase
MMGLLLLSGVSSESHALGRAPESEGWLQRFWREHRYHILTVFLLEQADHIYEDKVGPPETPRLFGSPSGFDRSVQERYGTASKSATFIASNKSALAQVLSVSAIVWANGGQWEGIADDAMGLIEAHKINWSTSSLVKNIVGRRRPSLEEALATGDPKAVERFGPSSRNSFPSDAASKAFTYMAYTDSVLARRLQDNRKARIWSAVGLYGLASYVAYTRIEQGKHYLSDVVVGAGAGFLVGKSVYRMNHDRHGHDEASFSIQPILVPGGAGITLSAAR